MRGVRKSELNLKQELFVKVLRLGRTLRIRENDKAHYNELDVISARIQYQAMYDFVCQCGLEEDYLIWREEREPDK